MDFNEYINNSIGSFQQQESVKGKPQEFTPEVASQVWREALGKTKSISGTAGNLPAVYGDSQMNLTFERYYMHPNFDKLGYSPWRDNDRLYNENSSWVSNLGRSTKAMGYIAGTAFQENLPFISTLDLFDPLDYEEEAAGNISRMMKIGYDTSGGLGAFTNNFLLNTGITLGIATSALAEEVGIALASGLMAKTGVGIPAAASTFGVGTFATLGKFARNIGKVITANKTLWNVASKADELKSIYDFSKIGRALDNKVVDFFNPLSATTDLLKNYPETFKSLNALGKASTSFGAFYKDARRSARVLNEAQLEGGLVLNQMVEDGIRKEYDATGQYPSEEKLASIRAAAENAAFATTMINLPLIHFSDKIGLDNIIAKLPKGKNLLSSLDDVKSLGEFTKIKGQGYKHITSPVKKITTSLKPTEIGKTFLNYTRYNFAEAIQENLQEATSAGVINYYTKLFENPMIDQSLLMKESVKLGIGEQFTAQGLETFFSGFLTGGLVGGLGKIATFGINGSKKLYDRKGWDEYTKQKAELIKQTEESATILDRSFLDLGRSPDDILNPNAVNAAQQSGANKAINNAQQSGNVKLSKDAQRLSLVEHVHNAIKAGLYNTIVDDYRSQLQADDKTLAEAFGRDISEVAQIRKDINSAITAAESIKKGFDKYNFPNPINLRGVSKDDPNYAKLVAKRNAIETVRKLLVMSEDAVMDGSSRMSKITQSLMDMTPQFGEIDSDDILSLLDTFRLKQYKIKQLRDEIKLSTETAISPTATPEDKLTASKKVEYLNGKLLKLTQVATTLDNIKEKIKSNTELTDEERKALVNDFKLYVEHLASDPSKKSVNVKEESIQDSLDYIVDYLQLESENDILTSVISVMQDPEGFAKTVNDTTDYLEGMLNNAQFYANSINRGISLLEHNALYNYMFNEYGVFVHELDDDKYVFTKPGPSVMDALTIIDTESEEHERLLNDFLEKKSALAKTDEEKERAQKLKEKAKAAAEKRAADKKSGIQKIKDFLKKAHPEYDEERLNLEAENIYADPIYRNIILGGIDDIQVLAQDIEDATVFTPTTKAEVMDALSLLYAALFQVARDEKGKGLKYYVQVDEKGNPIEDSLEWRRVTSLYSDKEFDNEKPSHRGNILDELLRTLIKNKNITPEEFKAAYEKVAESNKEATVFTDSDLLIVRSNFEKFIAQIEAEGYELIADIPTLWGEINGIKVAGTIDILAVNDKGEAVLIDLKTSNLNRRAAYERETKLKDIVNKRYEGDPKKANEVYEKVKAKIVNRPKPDNNKPLGITYNKGEEELQEIITAFIKENGFDKIFFYKDSDENQLNSYAELLKQRTGIKVKGMFILPLSVTDSKGKYTNISLSENDKGKATIDVESKKISKAAPVSDDDELGFGNLGDIGNQGLAIMETEINKTGKFVLPNISKATPEQRKQIDANIEALKKKYPEKNLTSKIENDKLIVESSVKPPVSDIEAEKQKITPSEFKEVVRLAKFFLENPKEPSVAGSIIAKYPELFKAVTDIERRRQYTKDAIHKLLSDDEETGDKKNTWRAFGIVEKNATNWTKDGSKYIGNTKEEVENKINARYDAELDALEETKTVDIQAKIDDIEKRRQEKLNKKNEQGYSLPMLIKDREEALVRQNKSRDEAIAKGIKDLAPYNQGVAMVAAALNRYNKAVKEINAISDAEYVDAINKGEMTKEQAMQALEKVGRKDSDAYKKLAELEGEGTTAKTSKFKVTTLNRTTPLKLPIYKNGVKTGDFYLSFGDIVDTTPTFTYIDIKGKIVTSAKNITTFSNTLFNDNPDLFNYWFTSILSDSERDNLVSKYNNIQSETDKTVKATLTDNFVKQYGIGIGIFKANKNLFKEPTSVENEISDQFAGKLVYGTPGIGKTALVEKYNARENRKYELIDVDDLLLNRLAEINQTTNFAGDLKFTNENLVAIINAFGKTIGTNQLDNLLYDPVLAQINEGKNEKNTNKIYLTGTKRFIKYSDIAILSKTRENILRDRIKTGESDMIQYLQEENQFEKGVILVNDYLSMKDMLTQNIQVISALNAREALKKNLFDRLAVNDDVLDLFVNSFITDNSYVDNETSFVTSENNINNIIKRNLELFVFVDRKSKEETLKSFYARINAILQYTGKDPYEISMKRSLVEKLIASYPTLFPFVGDTQVRNLIFLSTNTAQGLFTANITDGGKTIQYKDSMRNVEKEIFSMPVSDFINKIINTHIVSLTKYDDPNPPSSYEINPSANTPLDDVEDTDNPFKC